LEFSKLRFKVKALPGKSGKCFLKNNFLNKIINTKNLNKNSLSENSLFKN